MKQWAAEATSDADKVQMSDEKKPEESVEGGEAPEEQ